jgi:uracil-DNA glycosylase
MTDNQQSFFTALPASWQEPLAQICKKPEIDQLVQFLQEREQAGAIMYPEKKNIFAALAATEFSRVRVVIIGQDPYHGAGQAHGLSFSVPVGVAIPPSLKNIFKEVQADLGLSSSVAHGNLMSWAQQGVLLLNALLTVEAGRPASHAHKGWELFTDEILRQLLQGEKPLVCMLWGAYAYKKYKQVLSCKTDERHLILTAAHPSPFSAKKFFGCRHFSQANQFLMHHSFAPINWLVT